ncbi:hypothetical protein Tco_0515074 [Tanacetum coccineum]
MKEPAPRDLPPMPFLGNLKEQIGNKDVGWDITVEDVERLRQFLTPTIHILPNRELVVQPYMLLGPVHDKEKIIREEEQDYDVPLHVGVMQPLAPQIVFITPPDDDYVAPATNPILDKQLNEFKKEFSDITRVAKKVNCNPVNDVKELFDIKKYDCETFIRKLLHQAANLSTYTAESSRRFNSIYDDDEESTIPLNEIISQLPPSIAITTVLPTMEPEDSLIMRDENLSTIPEKESDEFIKSSVEDLVPILSKSEDTSDNDSECDLPFCDDYPPLDVLGGNFVTLSNPLFNDNDFTSSDDESLPEEDELKDIESEDSYVSKLDEPDLLVTHLSELNEDECFDPGGYEIEACLTSDSIPLGINGADFDPEGDILLLEKLLNYDISFSLPPKELYFKDLKMIKSSIDTPPDFEDGYYDSEGDIIYLESLLIKDTIPNLLPRMFLDHDPRSLKDEHDNDNLKSMVKVFDRGM